MPPDDDTPEGISPKRDSKRIPVQAGIHLRKSGYHKGRVDLLDVSPSGCRVELPERVNPGEIVWITFPGLQPMEAHVAWTKDWMAGLKFANPMHPAVFSALVSKIK